MNQNNGQVYQVLSPSQLDKQLQLSSDTEIESSPPPQKGLNLRPYLRTIKRKAILIAGITAMTTAAATSFGPKPPPSVYQGSFQLLVEPVTSAAKLSEPSRLARNEQKTNDKVFELDYSTILEILNSAKMRTNIINKIKEKYPTFKSIELQDSFTVERLVKEGTARGQSGETSIIQVTYQNSDPELAKIVLDAAAQAYLKYSLEERKTRIGEGVKFIEEQVPELQKRVDSSRKQLQAMQEQFNIIDPQKTGEELFAKLRQINDEKIAAKRQLQELNALANNLQGQLKLTLDEAINASTVSEDPSYQKLREDLKEIESQIATESARFEPEAPQIQALEEKKQNLQNLLDGELQRILGDNSASTTSNSQVLNFQNSTRQELIKHLADTKNQIQVLEVRNQQLIQTQRYFERQAQQFPAIANQYNITQQQLELTNQTLKQLLSQRETLRVEAAQDTVPWELISPPEIPRDANGNPIPMSSSSDKNLMMGVAAGLLLGLGTALLYEKFRDIFYTVEELEEVTQLPILSKIPLARQSKSSTNFA
ncbi:MAG: capsular biosynthesis protein, partial [Coleofasciculus sp. S288]|nr:capsular biosynthesis protein [Coleofasciculus sp. S288]